jgi:drug/metabolite transporter (DMT)-like permease
MQRLHATLTVADMNAMFAAAFALGAALCWGISDFLGGVKGRSVQLLSILLVSQCTALALLIALVILRGDAPSDPRFLLAAAAAGLGETLGVAALYRGLARGAMSIVAPIANVAPVVPFSVSIALGEVPAPVQIAGLLLVAGGIVLTSLESGAKTSTPGRRGASVAYGLLSALGFGIFFVGMDSASEGAIPWALLAARLTAVAAIAITCAVQRLRQRWQPSLSRRDFFVLCAIGALIVCADAMYAAASTRGLLAIVATLGALHPVVTVGLARVCLHEPIARSQYVGMAACFFGVVAIAAL